MAQAENTAIGAGFSVPAIDPDNGMEEKSSKSFIEAVRERRAERLNGPFTSFDATSHELDLQIWRKRAWGPTLHSSDATVIR